MKDNVRCVLTRLSGNWTNFCPPIHAFLSRAPGTRILHEGRPSRQKRRFHYKPRDQPSLRRGSRVPLFNESSVSLSSSSSLYGSCPSGRAMVKATQYVSLSSDPVEEH